MSTTSICVRMDTKLKHDFERFCNDVGMPMSTAINVFAQQTVYEHKIPFTIGTHTPQPNDETRKALTEVQLMKSDPSLGKAYSNLEELKKSLLNDEISN